MKWLPVPGFIGQYEVSDTGLVKRIGRGRGSVDGRILKATIMPAGYHILALWKDNRQHQMLVHRIVALAFLGPCPVGREVNHKNLKKADNRAVNLEYLTRSENILHATATGIGRGENNASCKLTEETVREIRRRHRDEGRGYKQLGKIYGVTWANIRQIVKHRSWRWLAE